MVFLRPTPSLKITQLDSTQPKPMDFEDHDEEIGDLPVGGGGGGGPTYDPPSLPIRKLTPETPGMGFGPRKSGGGRYRECQKNHAVNLGGHTVDGCGEFMPAGDDGTLDALKCAACNCHRNFHRKDSDVGGGGGGFLGITAPDPTGGFHHQQQQQQFSPTYYRTPGYLHHPHAVHQRMASAPLALPSTSDGGGSRDEQEGFSDPVGRGGSSSSLGKKRFRTKFTQEQKDKMLELAERLGWRMQKHDEGLVQQFCAETGVQRHVLKVWMHNNKHTLGKAPPSLVHHPQPQQQPVQDRDVAMEDGMPG